MPWYSTENVEDISILRLKGDASTRLFQWLGGLDGLLLRGRRFLVVSLEDVIIPSATYATFVAAFTRRIEDVEGEVVFVTPTDAHAQKILRQTGFSKVFPFVTTVAAGRSKVKSTSSCRVVIDRQ
jgi:hypothetical protein